ncbi:MAG: hypothetical protein HY548_01295, partial [Elusimicrobia bacterium]|nr:hypothetical protein [Elusimicrobiota bacterium]
LNVTLPVTGDFTLTLEPTGINWVTDSPKLEISVDGQKLSPADTLNSSPYALLAAEAETVVNNAITTPKIADGAVTNAKLAGNLNLSANKIFLGESGGTTYTLDYWQSTQPASSHLINGNRVQGATLPGPHASSHRPVSEGGTGGDVAQFAPSQIDGTAVAANAATTQTIRPSANVIPLIIKAPNDANPADVFELQNATAGSILRATNDGKVGIGDPTPDQALTVDGNISQTGVLISSGTGSNYFAGNVGIGTTNPGGMLNIRKDYAGTTDLRIENTFNGAGTSRLLLGAPSPYNFWWGMHTGSTGGHLDFSKMNDPNGPISTVMSIRYLGSVVFPAGPIIFPNQGNPNPSYLNPGEGGLYFKDGYAVLWYKDGSNNMKYIKLDVNGQNTAWSNGAP